MIVEAIIISQVHQCLLHRSTQSRNQAEASQHRENGYEPSDCCAWRNITITNSACCNDGPPNGIRYLSPRALGHERGGPRPAIKRIETGGCSDHEHRKNWLDPKKPVEGT